MQIKKRKRAKPRVVEFLFKVNWSLFHRNEVGWVGEGRGAYVC